jgi:hypothetical protein
MGFKVDPENYHRVLDQDNNYACEVFARDVPLDERWFLFHLKEFMIIIRGYPVRASSPDLRAPKAIFWSGRCAAQFRPYRMCILRICGSLAGALYASLHLGLNIADGYRLVCHG